PSGTQCLEHDCFSIFWEAKPFAKATAVCEEGGGHLMTVHSTVAEDVITLLLQNRTGSLCCPRLLPIEGLPITYTTPFGARGGDFLALPPLSTATIPAMGLELHFDPRAPTRCLLHCNRSQCPAECDPHTKSCECPEGFLLDGDEDDERVCVDINECDMDFCQHNCTNHPGGYECHCQAGYQLFQKNDCIKILEEDGKGEYSGDFDPGPQMPIPSQTPPKAEHLHPAALVGIAVGVLSASLTSLALGYHLAKKHCRSPTTMDY
ncbi:PREDICTED: thrombomodulin, partial [Cariama cristata]|uniref:thrombomodulin n=1 Tax=Cariama cristata TaxID=54380 RepID=UPI00052071F4